MKKIIIFIFSIFLFVSCATEKTNDNLGNSSNSGDELNIGIIGNIVEDNSDKTRLDSVDMILDGEGQIGTNVYEPYITGQNILTLSGKDSDGDNIMVLIAPELWSNYSTMDHNIGLPNVKVHFIGEISFLEDRDNISYYYAKTVEDLVLQD